LAQNLRHPQIFDQRKKTLRNFRQPGVRVRKKKEWSCRELNPPEERRSRPAGELASGQAGQRNEVELPGIEPAGGAAQPPGG
jgi:hypothetical protein